VQEFCTMSTVGDDEQDLTRKQRREQARAQRREAELAHASAAKRRARLMQLGIVGAVVIAAIVAIVVATSGGSKSHGIEKAKVPGTTPPVVKEVSTLIGGIPQSGNALGSNSAPVTLQYFGDLECPVCREFSLGALPPLIEKYSRTGKLRIEYRSLETATRDPETFRAQQIAALAAGKQNKLWYYIELFYKQQGEESSGYVTESYLRNLAQQVPGLNRNAWIAARSEPEFANAITTDAQAANNEGFTGTPSFLIGKSGGAMKKLDGFSLTNPSGYEAVIKKLLKS
jgi:protein-disulfide isomerase